MFCPLYAFIRVSDSETDLLELVSSSASSGEEGLEVPGTDASELDINSSNDDSDLK